MTIEVIDADGTVIEFPDGTPQETIAQVMRSRQRAPQRTQAAPSTAPFPSLEESAAAIPQSAVMRAAQRPLAPLTPQEQAARRAEEATRPERTRFRTPLSALPGRNVGERSIQERLGGLWTSMQAADQADREYEREAERLATTPEGQREQAANRARLVADVSRLPGRIAGAARQVPQNVQASRAADLEEQGQFQAQAPERLAAFREVARQPGFTRFERATNPELIEARRQREAAGRPREPDLGEDISEAIGDLPGQIIRESTYGPGADIRQARDELLRGRAMAAQGFPMPPGREQELLDIINERGPWAAGNVALAPADALLAMRAAASGVRQLPRLLPRGTQTLAPRGAPRPGRPPRPPPRARPLTPRQAAAEQRALDEAVTRDLEAEFGTLTAAERARDLRAMQREESLRRAGPEEARGALRDFNDMRAQQLSENTMRRLATRDLPPQNPDYASTGNTLADALRSQREAKLAERGEWYDRALELGAGDAIAPTDELLNTVLATSREHFGNLDNAAINIVRQLHDEIASGQATYSRIERARQALNAELGAAMRDPRGGPQVIAIHRIIDDLDAFAAPRVRPETRQAIMEARRLNREIAEAYGEQLRPELATGQTGRRDLGGATVRRILESDVVGERVMDTIFGAGARPSQATFAAVRRIVNNAKRQIASGGYTAPTGAQTGQATRTAGAATMRPGRGTRGGRTFDPSPAQQERFGTELPREDYQALREAFVYRLIKPLEARQSGDAIPFGALANNLRQALDGPGKEITELLLNPSEVAQARRLLRLMEQGAQPAGSYAPSAPGIAQDAIERSIGGLISRVVGGVPGLEGAGEAIRRGVRDARAIRDARAAIASPTVPRSPRVQAPGARPERAPQAAQEAASTPSRPPRKPPRRPRRPGPGGGERALSVLGTGGAIGAGALLAAPGEAQAAEGETNPRLEAVSQSIRDLEAEDNFYRTAQSRGDAAIRQAQGMLNVKVDGQWEGLTRQAAERRRAEIRADLERLRGEEQTLLRDAASQQAGHGFLTDPQAETVQVAPLALGALAAGLNRYRVLRETDDLITRGPLPDMRGGAAARAEAARRAGNINEFWKRGGAGARAPFRAHPERGFEVNPEAAPAGTLFPVRSRYRGGDVEAAAFGLAEAGGVELWLQNIRRDLAEAEADARANPTSVAARQEVERLRDLESVALGLQRFGLGLTGTAGLNPAFTRPNIGRADAERAILNAYFGRRPRPPRPPPAPPPRAPRKPRAQRQ